jgi:DNA polymerase IIIc chi subunit
MRLALLPTATAGTATISHETAARTRTAITAIVIAASTRQPGRRTSIVVRNRRIAEVIPNRRIAEVIPWT